MRFQGLDVLRLAGCLAILLHHMMMDLHPDGHWMDGLIRRTWLGEMMLLAFFITSGFVIPHSLRGPGPQAVRRFALARCFRLYPAFWLSMLVTWLVRYCPAWPPAAINLAANATMLPSVFGSEYLQVPYWSLEVELVFYLVCSLGYLLWGALTLRVALPLVLLFLGLDTAQLLTLPGIYWGRLWIHLAYMFWGTALRSWYETGRPRRPGLALGGVTVALLVPVALRVGAWFTTGDSDLLSWAFYRTAPFVLVLLSLRVQRVPPRLARLSLATYSMYLLHVPIYQLVLRFLGLTAPLELVYLASAVLMLSLGWLSFYGVEAPSMRLGQEVVRSLTDLSPARPSWGSGWKPALGLSLMVTLVFHGPVVTSWWTVAHEPRTSLQLAAVACEARWRGAPSLRYSGAVPDATVDVLRLGALPVYVLGRQTGSDPYAAWELAEVAGTWLGFLALFAVLRGRGLLWPAAAFGAALFTLGNVRALSLHPFVWPLPLAFAGLVAGRRPGWTALAAVAWAVLALTDLSLAAGTLAWWAAWGALTWRRRQLSWPGVGVVAGAVVLVALVGDALSVMEPPWPRQAAPTLASLVNPGMGNLLWGTLAGAGPAHSNGLVFALGWLACVGCALAGRGAPVWRDAVLVTTGLGLATLAGFLDSTQLLLAASLPASLCLAWALDQGLSWTGGARGLRVMLGLAALCLLAEQLQTRPTFSLLVEREYFATLQRQAAPGFRVEGNSPQALLDASMLAQRSGVVTADGFSDRPPAGYTPPAGGPLVTLAPPREAFEPSVWLAELTGDLLGRPPTPAEVKLARPSQRLTTAIRVFQEFSGPGGEVVRYYHLKAGRLPTMAEFREGLALARGQALGQLGAPELVERARSAALREELFTRTTVALCYYGFLGRPPDPGGLDGWSRTFETTSDIRELVGGFLDSSERQSVRERK